MEGIEIPRRMDVIRKHRGRGGLIAVVFPIHYPREIKDVLYEHPKVQEAAAIGIPLPGKGERGKVFIKLKEGQTASEEEIITFCWENLAPYKVPKYVEFCDQLPKTLVGKILRRELVKEEAGRQAGEGAKKKGE